MCVHNKEKAGNSIIDFLRALPSCRWSTRKVVEISPAPRIACWRRCSTYQHCRHKLRLFSGFKFFSSDKSCGMFFKRIRLTWWRDLSQALRLTCVTPTCTLGDQQARRSQFHERRRAHAEGVRDANWCRHHELEAIRENGESSEPGKTNCNLVFPVLFMIAVDVAT